MLSPFFRPDDAPACSYPGRVVWTAHERNGRNVAVPDLDGCWAVWPESAAWQAVLAGQVFAVAGRTPPPPMTVPGKGNKSIGVLAAEGILAKNSYFGTSTARLRADLATLAADPNIQAILIRISSPGGTVSGMTDLADAVTAAKRKKPVWAHVEDLGASAAYWLASQADMVFANSPTALVGSIGTVWVKEDSSAMAAGMGVKVLPVVTGPLKAAGEPGTPITDEHLAYFQGIVNYTQSLFDAAVVRGRNLTADQLAAVRTGGVFVAPEARRLKLIDGIRSLDSTLKALADAK